jgi:small subunit ribosomal protein S17e
MGRIKSKGIKTLADDLLSQHGDKFTDKFESNKEALKEMQMLKSKKIRNIVAGSITRKMVRQKREESA